MAKLPQGEGAKVQVSKSFKNKIGKRGKKPVTIEPADCILAMKTNVDMQVKKMGDGKKRNLKTAQGLGLVKPKLAEEQDGPEAKKPKTFNKTNASDKFKNKKNGKGGGVKEGKRVYNKNFVGINGKIETMYFDQFPVKKEEGQRLIQLKKDLTKTKLPRHVVEKAMIMEKRQAKKVLLAERKRVCFACRQSGHNMSNCPAVKDGSKPEPTKICFKCGSAEHISLKCKVVKGDCFKFATCLVCAEVGHISRQCPSKVNVDEKSSGSNDEESSGNDDEQSSENDDEKSSGNVDEKSSGNVDGKSSGNVDEESSANDDEESSGNDDEESSGNES